MLENSKIVCVDDLIAKSNEYQYIKFKMYNELPISINFEYKFKYNDDWYSIDVEDSFNRLMDALKFVNPFDIQDVSISFACFNDEKITKNLCKLFKNREDMYRLIPIDLFNHLVEIVGKDIFIEITDLEFLDNYEDMNEIDVRSNLIIVLYSRFRRLYKVLNEHEKEIKELICDIYLKMGQMLNIIHLRSKIQNYDADKIIKTDENDLMAFYKSVFSSYYIFPKGIKIKK